LAHARRRLVLDTRRRILQLLHVRFVVICPIARVRRLEALLIAERVLVAATARHARRTARRTTTAQPE
jgi:hypothetical protein